MKSFVPHSCLLILRSNKHVPGSVGQQCSCCGCRQTRPQQQNHTRSLCSADGCAEAGTDGRGGFYQTETFCSEEVYCEVTGQEFSVQLDQSDNQLPQVGSVPPQCCCIPGLIMWRRPCNRQEYKTHLIRQSTDLPGLWSAAEQAAQELFLSTQGRVGPKAKGPIIKVNSLKQF